jgi:hypothetical protein
MGGSVSSNNVTRDGDMLLVLKTFTDGLTALSSSIVGEARTCMLCWYPIQ